MTDQRPNNALTLRQALAIWKPDTAVHCRNCLHAKVSLLSSDVMAYCEHGHGEPRLLIRLLRKNAPGFMAALKCKNYEWGE